jgi:CheY-like chemotaxis protein
VAAAQHPDVVLVDIEMPHMDGRQVARQLRRDFPGNGCLIIAIVGQYDDRCHQECWDAGIDLVLLKPVSPTVLETLLMLESARLNRSMVNQRETSRSLRKRLSGVEQDEGVKDLPARMVAGISRKERPKGRWDQGGPPC